MRSSTCRCLSFPLRSAAILVVAALAVSACHGPDGETDEQQINDAILQLQTTPNRRICVDSGTYGEPLAVFRTMILAPQSVRRELNWYPPSPLASGSLLTLRRLAKSEFQGDQIVVNEHAPRTDLLPLTARVEFNAAAKAMSLMDSENGVTVKPSASAPLATVRWWVRNRLDPSCVDTFTISKPVIARTSAFVSVTAGHQGTTYALHKAAGQWSVIATWSQWLY